MFESSAAKLRLELITHEPGHRGIALTEMREDCVGTMLDHLVVQCLLRPVACVTPMSRAQLLIIRATVTFGETENQRVTSVLRMGQASQVTILVKVLDSVL